MRGLFGLLQATLLLTSVLASILFFFFVNSGLFENICFRVLSAVIYHVYSAGGEKIQLIL